MKKRFQTPRRFDLRILLLILILVNLLVIDVWLFGRYFAPARDVLGETSSACPQACINYINSSTGSGVAAKEYFVPLGSGTNQSTGWQDVEGAQSYVDSTLYRKAKKTTFEATLEVPSGSQITYVRLYNATDQHPVWFSEVNMDGSGPKLLVSAPITLDPGEKLYKVQMKSQLAAKANLVQSRLHIQTN